MPARQEVAETWLRHAACRGSEVFIAPMQESSRERPRRENAAKRVCAECTVQPDCLAYALRVREPLGIWGGLNEIERRDLLAH